MKMSLNKKFLFFLFLSFPVLVMSREVEEKFERANNAYIEEQYQEAADLYAGLVEEGYQNAALFYNLGNTYYRLNKIPEAILFFEKAQKLNPRNEDYQYNLSLAKTRIIRPLEEVPEFFLNNWWRSLAEFIPSTGWSILGLILLWAGMAGGIVWLLGKKRWNRKLGFFLGVFFLSVCILPFLLAGSRVKMAAQHESAIVLQSGTALKSAPESDQDLTEIPAGTKIKLIDIIGDWHKAQLPNGEIGWIRQEVFEKI